MTPPPSKVAALRSKDLLGIGELEPDEISLILDTAESMRSIGQREIKKVPALRGRMVANLFFEPLRLRVQSLPQVGPRVTTR